ncbi:hypothetical protein GCM10010412_039410 [Nonomuraea recticatena]|uniref:Uncharacterized protein n=1 Tax=Nonomuraea recticatena TaxID=46178 RepID=A0ABP6EFS4_9ACTN
MPGLRGFAVGLGDGGSAARGLGGFGVGVVVGVDITVGNPSSIDSAASDELGADLALDVLCGPSGPLEHAQATTATTTSTATRTVIRRRQ